MDFKKCTDIVINSNKHDIAKCISCINAWFLGHSYTMQTVVSPSQPNIFISESSHVQLPKPLLLAQPLIWSSSWKFSYCSPFDICLIYSRVHLYMCATTWEEFWCRCRAVWVQEHIWIPVSLPRPTAEPEEHVKPSLQPETLPLTVIPAHRQHRVRQVVCTRYQDKKQDSIR